MLIHRSKLYGSMYDQSIEYDYFLWKTLVYIISVSNDETIAFDTNDYNQYPLDCIKTSENM